MTDGDWIYEKWQNIDKRVDDMEDSLGDSEAALDLLLTDVKFLQIMIEEELL